MYRDCVNRVFGYALRRAPLEVAQDAVADAFLAAWRRFDELPPDPLPWLIQATRRTLANQRRSVERQLRLAARLANESARHGEAPFADDADGALVRSALARLTSDDREVLALVAWDGLTPTQAARSLECSPVAFRVRLHRARKRFGGALADLEARDSDISTSLREPPTDVREVS